MWGEVQDYMTPSKDSTEKLLDLEDFCEPFWSFETAALELESAPWCPGHVAELMPASAFTGSCFLPDDTELKVNGYEADWESLSCLNVLGHLLELPLPGVSS